jgi:hypothetical protein
VLGETEHTATRTGSLHVFEGTVKGARRLLAKLELRDRNQLIVFAHENGVVRPRVSGE